MVTGQFIPAHAVDRPELRDDLDIALERPLTLVTAQAGSGKSVLLSQWVAAHPETQCAWVDVSKADNDPGWFERHLIDEFATIDPILAANSVVVETAGRDVDPEFLTPLAGQLRTMGETVFVLDDLHYLSNQPLVRALGVLIEALPANIHVVVSSRVDFPIAWSRNRLRHDVPEIRQAALAMTYEQSAELLASITGHELDPASVAVLLDRTEGWAAGLQLAGMTLRLSHDPEKFIAEFSGSDRLVADYLSEEVLTALPASERASLLDISVLDRMSSELIAEIADAPSSSELLSQLENHSMFLIPMDESREWYRFHPLFRDLLRYRKRSDDPAAEHHILTRAAQWHLHRGDTGAAIDYLLRARDWDGAIDAILARCSDVFERGDVATVARWLNALPENAIADRVDVLLMRGILTGMSGAAALGEDRLRSVIGHPLITPPLAACALTFLAALVHWRPRPRVSIEWAERALAAIDALGDTPTPRHLPDTSVLRTIAMIARGRAHFLDGDLPDARRWLEDALATEGAGYSAWRISALGSLALLDAWGGRIRDAEQIITEAFALAREMGNWYHPATAETHLANALVAIMRADTDHAQTSLREGSIRAHAMGRDLLAWIAYAEGGALSDLSADVHEQRLPAGPPPPVVADTLLARRSRALRLSGSSDGALRLLGGNVALTSSVAFEHAAAALMLGQHETAQEVVKSLADLSDASEPIARVRELILNSWCSATAGMDARADALLAEALALADEYSLVTVFVEAGPVTVRRMAGLADDSLPRIRESVLDTAVDALEIPVPSELVDSLTDRELELLALLPTRLTNTELADRFVVSVNTIKTHMAHIYRKLDVSNRSGAITKAVQLGLIKQRWTPPIVTGTSGDPAPSTQPLVSAPAAAVIGR
ncbi:LuxR C-terminal-related transcriptional regulator [Leifsonia poae]|uniref:LuxR C-terminal-related transcriptional regulator n=1 Tax=Leifsonia poae TaxID=110933 RepID=UPI003D672E5A